MNELTDLIKQNDLKELFETQRLAIVYGETNPTYKTLYEEKKKEYCLKYNTTKLIKNIQKEDIAERRLKKI